MKWGRRFRNRAADSLPLYLFLFGLLLAGMLFGALLNGALSGEQREELARFSDGLFQSFLPGGGDVGTLHASDGGGAQGTAEDPLPPKSPSLASPLAASLRDSLRWIGFVWLFGCSIIGVPLVLLLDFAKGVSIGFSVGFLVGEYAWRGVGIALAAVVLHNLALVPALLAASVAALSFAAAVVRFLLFRRPARNRLAVRFARFSAVTVLAAGCAALAALLEARAAPMLLEWILPRLLEEDAIQPSILSTSIL